MLSGKQDYDAGPEEQRQEAPSYDPPPTDYADIPSVDLESVEDVRAAKDVADLIVDTARGALLVLDLDLKVQAANESFYRTFGAEPEETIGRRVYELGNRQWDLPELHELLEDILPESNLFNDYAVTHEFEGIGRRDMLLHARRLDDHQLILLAIDDVTGRRSAEASLQEVQERYRLFVEGTREYAMLMMDPEGTITMWNRGAERLFGYDAEEARGRPVALIFTEEDRAREAPESEMETAVRQGQAPDERWHLCRDGSTFWGVGTVTALHDAEGTLRGFAKVLRDETERREARQAFAALTETLEERVEERTRQVRTLASTLTLAEQRERRRISQILHDDLQQLLYGIQLKLHLAEQAADRGATEELKAHHEEIDAWIRRSVELTRSLTVDLSPPVLKDDGLVDTLGWLKSPMQEQHELEVKIEAEQAFRTPDDNMRALLFQIVRELLINVVKHAQTDRATILLRDVNHHVEIVVADEGRGFDVEEALAQGEEGEGFGLYSARERLTLFGGELTIDSAPGAGTRVTASVPLRLE